MNTPKGACSNQSLTYTNAAVIYARVNVYDLPIYPSTHLAYNTYQNIQRHIDNQFIEGVFLIISKPRLSPTTGGWMKLPLHPTHRCSRRGTRPKQLLEEKNADFEMMKNKHTFAYTNKNKKL
ncbi:MAG: hypothetical protein IKU00_07535 [Bacteroidales bacterium]|nr:hypothetical protein [Bacteroidales bacterium]